MQTNPVESSMIARVGYESGILRAVMKDGSVYDVPGCSAEEFAAFMADPSKGQHWIRNFKSRAFKAGDATDLPAAREASSKTPPVEELEKILNAGKGGNVDCHFGVQSMRRAR